jgi:hypothetical protein
LTRSERRWRGSGGQDGEEGGVEEGGAGGEKRNEKKTRRRRSGEVGRAEGRDCEMIYLFVHEFQCEKHFWALGCFQNIQPFALPQPNTAPVGLNKPTAAWAQEFPLQVRNMPALITTNPQPSLPA